LEFGESGFQEDGFLGVVGMHLDFFCCFLRHLQAGMCRFPEFGGRLGGVASGEGCSAFEVWLRTDLDSAARDLMEAIIGVYICLKTRAREISIERGSDHLP
jgi:hypothetical protein